MTARPLLTAALLLASSCSTGPSPQASAEVEPRQETKGPSDRPSPKRLVLSEGVTKLPPPELELPFPLMKALGARRSERAFSPRPLPDQTLGDLLWAAAGVNRPDEGRRTAPSAHNRQEVDLYVTLAEGLFLYRPTEHALEKLAGDDLRARTGKQPYVAEAPVNLVYVSDLERMMGSNDVERREVTFADVGFMAQNAYLYGAAVGLAVVVRGSIDADELGRAMTLRPRQQIILAQSIGYPAEAGQ